MERLRKNEHFYNIEKELEDLNIYHKRGKQMCIAGGRNDNNSWRISNTHHWNFGQGRLGGKNADAQRDTVRKHIGLVYTSDNILDEQPDSEVRMDIVRIFQPECMTGGAALPRRRVEGVQPEYLDMGGPVGFDKLKDLWDVAKNFPKSTRILTDYLIDMSDYKDADAFYLAHPDQVPRVEREGRAGVGGA